MDANRQATGRRPYQNRLWPRHQTLGLDGQTIDLPPRSFGVDPRMSLKRLSANRRFHRPRFEPFSILASVKSVALLLRFSNVTFDALASMSHLFCTVIGSNDTKAPCPSLFVPSEKQWHCFDIRLLHLVLSVGAVSVQ